MGHPLGATGAMILGTALDELERTGKGTALITLVHRRRHGHRHDHRARLIARRSFSMNLTNFRFETDADGIALVTWDMPGRSMNVINAEVVGELGQIVDKIASDAAIKGAVFTSGKDGFAAGADLTMLETAGEEYARRAKAEGKEAAMRAFVDGTEPISAHLPTTRNLRQTGRRRDQRRVHGRRLRTRAGVPLSHRRGNATRRASDCRRSRSGSSPAAAERSAWRG